ncbi:hypothetical protein CC78DRAFT_611894 [Lojkania enalia]|uniref:Uncharacterized protein n=1 Tax=Lojkania enalia TaxID=147567 RepID=A0A9P4NBL4_9PLEO|nr:hypothetical protein CC78DRAFT_611894 [Didymosphaeria enalia]
MRLDPPRLDTGLASNDFMLALSRVGRRPLINVTLGIAAALWFSMGIANCSKGGVVPWWMAASIMLIVIVCGIGFWDHHLPSPPKFHLFNFALRPSVSVGSYQYLLRLVRESLFHKISIRMRAT